MNTRLLRRVAKHILAEPKRFAMGDFIQTKEDSYNGKFSEDYHDGGETQHRFASCGTAACIGGWATILGKGDKRFPANEGRRLLDLTEEQSDLLFYVGNWPEKFDDPYMKASTPAKRVRIAIARIEHFIKTKGKE